MNISVIKTRVFKADSLYATIEYDGNIGHVYIEGSNGIIEHVDTYIGAVEDFDKCKRLLSKITGKLGWEYIL